MNRHKIHGTYSLAQMGKKDNSPKTNKQVIHIIMQKVIDGTENVDYCKRNAGQSLQL